MLDALGSNLYNSYKLLGIAQWILAQPYSIEAGWCTLRVGNLKYFGQQGERDVAGDWDKVPHRSVPTPEPIVGSFFPLSCVTNSLWPCWKCYPPGFASACPASFTFCLFLRLSPPVCQMGQDTHFRAVFETCKTLSSEVAEFLGNAIPFIFPRDN